MIIGSWILLIFYALALAFIFFYSLSQMHLVILYLKDKQNQPVETPKLEIKDYPLVTVQLPLYNELYVVDRLIDCIASLHYPKEKLEIQLLDDSNDETTAIIEKKINKYQSVGLDIQLIRRPDRTGYKAGALKYGLEKAKGEFIAIFDADFLPRVDFLLKTIPHLVTNQKLGVVQTRWEHLNKDYSYLTKLQAFGLDAHFTVEQVGRNSAGHFINFNGTGGVWRKACIYDAGNWQADTLTEDLDLSYRAQLCGWDFKYLEHIGAPAELPATMNALKSQQFRWTKGAAENTMKNLKRVFEKKLPFGTKFHSTFHLLNSGVFLSVLISSLLSVPVILAKTHVPSHLVFLFQAASIFLLSLLTLGLFYGVSYFQLNGKSFKAILSFLFHFPLFLSLSMGLSLHNGIAVIEGYLGKKSPFIRTPKFNIKEKGDSWKENIYKAKNIGWLTILEGVLTLYFGFGIWLGVHYHDYYLVAFHIMLMMGFATVFYFSIKHARYS